MTEPSDISGLDRQIAEAAERLKTLDAERVEVRGRLEALRCEREALTIRQTVAPIDKLADAPVTKDSPAEAKVVLFRTLFRGRENVYPRRWESGKTGKSGYQPVCRNDWVRGLCDKPRVKCSECPAREFLPLTDAVIRAHLKGADIDEKPYGGVQRDFTIGVYPLLPDETCWFVAADFDKESWHADVVAFQETCRHVGVPIAVERSRSGDGGHVWMFFAEPVPAITARRLATFLITETLERRPELGFDSYDRLFPSQDTMPKGGFGNLIALPLQRKPRERGNSVFVDSTFLPFTDQWAFLSSCKRLSRTEVDRVVEDAARRGRIMGVRMPVAEESDEEPWKTPPSRRMAVQPISGPLPEKLCVTLGNLVYIKREGLPPALRSRIIRLAAFQNPEFCRAQAMRVSTWDKPRVISCAEEYSKYIGLPRGCYEELLDLAQSLSIKVELTDERVRGCQINARFTGALRPEQEKAAHALLAHDTGVLAAATAFGKTVVAAHLIAERGVNTLVLVHRRQLLDQWVAQLGEFLDLGKHKIGVIGGGKHKPTGILDVAVIQSLGHKGTVDDLVGTYGHIVVDECHHVSASSFELVARQAKAMYVTGLSATVTRQDGHHPIVFMQCGPMRYHVSAKQGTAAHPFMHRVVFRETGFKMKPREDRFEPTIHDVYDTLETDQHRNDLIFEDILTCIDKEKRSPIVITERREHLEMFARRLQPFIRNLVVFKGGMGKQQRQAICDQMAAIPDDEERLLLATGRYLGEGFDDARLDTLFLTMPVSWRGVLAQYAGRLHRLHYGKTEVRVYDYVDSGVSMLARMYRKRLRGYKAIGYEVG